jgi:ferric-dicitrate binding protein FerR (iron transport regulator)
MIDTSFDELLNGYINNLLTREELAHFLQLLQNEEYATRFKNSIEPLFGDNSFSALADQNKADIIFQKLMDTAAMEEKTRRVNEMTLKPRVKILTFSRIAVAASVIGLLLFGAYSWFSRMDKKEIATSEIKNSSYKNDVLPGGDKAMLTLADGSTIVLNDAQNGNLVQQGNTKVIKLDGKLAYNAANAGIGEILYNTISTPRGGQYQVELPDGSKVWLNAASSLHFPTAFVGKERRVEISGEAYFEVAKNKSMPFIVSVNGSEIQVLGTHFNVMAYNDEDAVKTTLLEGSVKFASGNNSSLLKPGQQAQLTTEGQVKVVSDVDVDEVVAWKNGMFDFEDASLGTVTRQLARWYDVDILNQNKNIEDLFVVEMPRSSKLSDVLKVLELTGNIKFEIDGKKIIVMQ